MESKKYFISADIEGVTDVTAWCETEKGGDGYEAARAQMTKEVAAACEAILEAGHEVIVRDGHDSALNISHALLPQGVQLMRGWACHPGSMMAGLNNSFDGVIYIGYHAPGGSDGSPLAHTMSYSKINWIKVNGALASEFTINTLYAAEKGVAPIFISGDEYICNMAKSEVPAITTTAVKRCRGNSTFNLHPLDACHQIKLGVASALNKSVEVPTLPKELVLDVCLRQHQHVRRALAHKDVVQIDDFTVRYIAHSPMEMNVMREFITG